MLSEQFSLLASLNSQESILDSAFYFMHTEIFASNFALSKSGSDFTSTNQRGETSFSHMKKSFCPITNQLKPWFK